jgi:hypothetical protein
MKPAGTKEGKSRLDVPLSMPTGFGIFADRFKDLPPDYWTNSNYGPDFASLFADERTHRPGGKRAYRLGARGESVVRIY